MIQYRLSRMRGVPTLQQVIPTDSVRYLGLSDPAARLGSQLTQGPVLSEEFNVVRARGVPLEDVGHDVRVH